MDHYLSQSRVGEIVNGRKWYATVAQIIYYKLIHNVSDCREKRQLSKMNMNKGC